jgi:hypothetical protein
MRMSTVRGGVISGVALAAFGGMLLVGAIMNLNLWAFIWPYFIVVPGLLCLIRVFARGRDALAAAIVGCMLTMLGFLLFYQNLFGYFQSWAYAWALVAPTAVGLGLALYGRVKPHAILLQVGSRLAAGGFVLFLLLGMCFEVGVFQNNSVIKFAVPALLIVLGLALALGSLARLATRQTIDTY